MDQDPTKQPETGHGGDDLSLPISELSEPTAKMILAMANKDQTTPEEAARKLLDWFCNPKAA